MSGMTNHMINRCRNEEVLDKNRPFKRRRQGELVDEVSTSSANHRSIEKPQVNPLREIVEHSHTVPGSTLFATLALQTYRDSLILRRLQGNSSAYFNNLVGPPPAHRFTSVPFLTPASHSTGILPVAPPSAFHTDLFRVENNISHRLQSSTTKDQCSSIGGSLRASSQLKHLPLATDEDQNWLSEFQCFIRSELVEVFRATQQDIEDRKNNKHVCVSQVGMRCRFCVHLPLGQRAGRSSAFPSSTRQIYQSFAMMVREHFQQCSAVPPSTKKTFLDLQKKASQGNINSKAYWEHAAAKLGMIDSDRKIVMDEMSRIVARQITPFGISPSDRHCLHVDPPVFFVSNEDRGLISDFLYNLMLQCQRIKLLPSECKGNRSSFKPGLPGLGCRFCQEAGRLGFSRIFPVNRKKLPSQVYGFYDHIRRCTLCPLEVKLLLSRLGHEERPERYESSGADNAFFDLVWVKLGHRME